MPILPKPNSPTLARLANYAENTLTIIGFGLTTMSGIGLSVFLILEALGLIDNPYVGLLGMAFLPGVFVGGLVAMPIGMLFRRRALLRRGALPEEVGHWPRLDFNDAHLRRAAVVVGVLTVVNLVLITTTSAAV